MNSCLGIYLDDNVIKYAKLDYDSKNNVMQVNTCGVKQVMGDKLEILYSIVDETGSLDLPIAINLSNTKYKEFEMLKQLNKNDVQNILALEVFDIANEMEINEKTLTYKYLVLNSKGLMDNNNIMMAVTDKATLEQYIKNEKIKVGAIYPLSFVLEGIIEKTDKSYICVNIESETEAIIVSGGSIDSIKNLGIGMEDIMSKIATHVGSMSKAYETCKSINVFTDSSSTNDPEIEKIIEPVIQDILHRVEEKIKTSKKEITKIYISGLGTLFTNIDMLFEEYFGISSSILKPYFLDSDAWNSNISDIIEVNEAIALAHEYLKPGINDINFIDNKLSKGRIKDVPEKSIRKKFDFKDLKFDLNKIINITTFSNIIIGSILLIYIFFGIIYNSTTSKMEKKLSQATNILMIENLKVQSDIDYININTKKYSDINAFVSETIRKIEGNEIGKYSTYNVANFMQKIVKYTPKGVKVVAISSDDNKKVAMSAESVSYSDLGYFISQLKLKGILENVIVNKVEHSNSITVTIGGDLP